MSTSNSSPPPDPSGSSSLPRESESEDAKSDARTEGAAEQSSASVTASNTQPSQPGVVDGSEAADVVDRGFTDDPELDETDTLSKTGTGSDDDLIRLNGGDDTVFAGLGSDTIEGGAGRDTYIVDNGPFVIADPVLTSFDDLPDVSTVVDPGGTLLFDGVTAPILFKTLEVGGSQDTGSEIPALDGGILVREPGSDGDPADLGGFATEFEESELGFFLRSLPEDGRLFIDEGTNVSGDPVWREIQQSEIVSVGSAPTPGSLRLSAGDRLNWVADQSDLTLDPTVTIGGINQPLSVWENPSADLRVELSATDLRGDDAAIVTQEGVPGSDGSTISDTIQGGLGIAGLGPNVVNDPTREAEINRGFGEFDGRSEELTVRFTDASGDAQIVANAQIFISAIDPAEGEFGTLLLFRSGELLDELTFGPFVEGVSAFEPDLILSFDDTFDTPASGFIDVSGYLFDTVILSASNSGLLRPPDQNPEDISEFYVDAIVVDPVAELPGTQAFDYFVEAPNGQASFDSQIQISDRTGEPLRLVLDDATDTFEGGNAVFTVRLEDEKGDPATSEFDTVIQLSLVDGTATQGDGISTGDFSNANSVTPTDPLIDVTIPAGVSSISVAVPVRDDGIDEESEVFFLQVVDATNQESAVIPTDIRAAAVIGNSLQADPVTTSWGIFTDNLDSPASSFAKEFTLGGTLDGEGPEPTTTTTLVRPAFTENGIPIPEQTIELGPQTGAASLGGDDLFTDETDPNLEIEITRFPEIGRLLEIDELSRSRVITEANPFVSSTSNILYEIPRASFRNNTADIDFATSPLSGVDDTGTANIVASEAGSIVNVREFSFGPTQVDTNGNALFSPLNAGETMIMRFTEDMSFLIFQGAFNGNFRNEPFAQNWAEIVFLKDGEVVEAGTIGSNALAQVAASNPGGSIPEIDFLPETLDLGINDIPLFSFSGFVFDEVRFTAGPTVPGLIGNRSEFSFFDLYAAGEVEAFEYRVVDRDTNRVSDPEVVTIQHPVPDLPQNSAEVTNASLDDEDVLAFSTTALDPGGVPTLSDVLPETVSVTVDDQGDGTVNKLNSGTTDDVSSVQNFVAAEEAGQQDSIRLTTSVSDAADITGISNDAAGTFTVASDGSIIVFGPTEDQTFSDVLALDIAGTFNITSGDESGQVGDISFENFEIISFDFMVCFLRGTRIRTPFGERRIETLREGELVDTVDAGPRPVRWVGSTAVLGRGKNAPIRFKANSIGNKADLYLSPNHRVALNHPLVELHFGAPTVLLPAKAFVNGRTVTRVQSGRVEYFHLLLENHHVVFAEGAECESLFFGDMAERTLFEAHRAELIRRRFGQIETWKDRASQSSFVCLTVNESKMLLSSIAAVTRGQRDVPKTPARSMAPFVH